MLKGRVVVFVISCGATFALPAKAQPRATTQLDFASDATPTNCPGEAAFRERVAVRLGYDPFVDASTSRVRVRFSSRGTRVVAKVDIERDGRPAGTRALDETAARCDVLFDAIAATVAIALDPVTRPRDPNEAHEATPPPADAPPANDSTPSRPPAVATSPDQDHAAEPAVRTRPYALVDALASVGVAPGATLGAQAGIGLRRSTFVIAAEGRIEATPSDVELKSRDRVTSSGFFGGIAPCLRFGIAALCLGVRIGSLQASSRDVTRPALKSSFVAMGFARAVVVVPLSSAFGFRVGAEAAVPFIRTTFSIDNEAIWIAPPVNGSLLAGLEWAAP